AAQLASNQAGIAHDDEAAAAGDEIAVDLAGEVGLPPAAADGAEQPAAELAPADPLAEPLDVPTALDRLVEEQKSGSGEAQAEALTRELEGSSSRDRIGALAYELGELCERQLGDEARAVKAFGRALQADPSLRSNLWAIRDRKSVGEGKGV